MATNEDTHTTTPATVEVSMDEEVTIHPRYIRDGHSADGEGPGSVRVTSAAGQIGIQSHPERETMKDNRPIYGYIGTGNLLSTPAAGDSLGQRPRLMFHSSSPDTHTGKSTCDPAVPVMQPRCDDQLPSRSSEMMYPQPVPSAPQFGSYGKPRYIPDRYDGTTPWRDYIAHFESCARINGWNDLAKCNYLAVGLRGQAQQILNDIGMEHLNYAGLVKLLECRYGPGERAEFHLAELRHRQRAPGESLQELAQAMRRLTGMAYPEMNKENQDRLARIHFVDAIQDKELRMTLFQARPSSLDEAIRVALEVESYLESETIRSGGKGSTRQSRVMELQRSRGTETRN